MPGSILFVDLGLDASNDDILAKMRILKLVREENRSDNVVCCIRGFGVDPRELHEIPEVRAFCRRLTSLGFISYLDFTTLFNPDLAEAAAIAWGAAEVWLCGEGRMRVGLPFTDELLDELKAA